MTQLSSPPEAREVDADPAALFDDENGREGVRSFIERREARFVGR